MSQDEEKEKILDFASKLQEKIEKKEADEAAANEATDPRALLVKLAVDSANKDYPMVLVVSTDDGITISTTVQIADSYLLLALGQEILKGTVVDGNQTIH